MLLKLNEEKTTKYFFLNRHFTRLSLTIETQIIGIIYRIPENHRKQISHRHTFKGFIINWIDWNSLKNCKFIKNYFLGPDQPKRMSQFDHHFMYGNNCMLKSYFGRSYQVDYCRLCDHQRRINGFYRDMSRIDRFMCHCKYNCGWCRCCR